MLAQRRASTSLFETQVADPPRPRPSYEWFVFVASRFLQLRIKTIHFEPRRLVNHTAPHKARKHARKTVHPQHARTHACTSQHTHRRTHCQPIEKCTNTPTYRFSNARTASQEWVRAWETSLRMHWELAGLEGRYHHVVA